MVATATEAFTNARTPADYRAALRRTNRLALPIDDARKLVPTIIDAWHRVNRGSN